jgi:hypothetical protein
MYKCSVTSNNITGKFHTVEAAVVCLQADVEFRREH